jgi:hypothetical protein
MLHASTITNFIITQWIWSITGGFSYLPINFILLFLLLKLWGHFRMFKALLMSSILTFVPFLLFFGVIGIVFVWGFQVQFILPETAYEGSYNNLNSSLIMSGIYMLIQIPLLSLICKYTQCYHWKALLCLVCSNIMTALLIYKMTFSL